MPFPGPAKEQRMTHDIIQVGNAEKKEKIREQANETFCEKQLYGPNTARETYESGSRKSQKGEKRKTGPYRPERRHGQTRREQKEKLFLFPSPQMQARVPFYSKFSARSLFLLSLALEQGMDGESMRVLQARRREGGKKRLDGDAGVFVYDSVRCSF
jgi:hypothetical protein